MKRKLNTFIIVLLVVALIFSSNTFAIDNYENCEFKNMQNKIYVAEAENDAYILHYRYSDAKCAECTCAYSELNETELADVFNIHYTPGAAHVGYIFRISEDARVSVVENENIRTIYAPENLFVAATIEDISSFVAPEFIVHIEPDYIIYRDPMPIYACGFPAFAPHAFAPTNDPRYRDQWNLEIIRGAAAWSSGSGSRPRPTGVVVAVIDSGIYRDHVDLNPANILLGENFAVSTCGRRGICDACRQGIARGQFDLADESGHGTAVTGVIAATRGNNIGIASMACGVTILPLRVFTGVGLDERSTTSAVAGAIRHAISEGAHIINMSLAGYGRSLEIENAVNAAAARGIWMIVAAGNSGGTAMQYPAGFHNVIGVGSANKHGRRAAHSQMNTSVFVLAPGGERRDPINDPDWLEGVLVTNNVGGSNAFRRASGTSFAAPHITALAAIARAHDPNMSVDRFRNLLRVSAIPRGVQNASGRNDQYGYGIVDVGLFMRHLTGEYFFNFIDVPRTHWAWNHVRESARYGIMHGRQELYVRGNAHGTQHSFLPDHNMWRLEFPMALGRLHELNRGNINWTNAPFIDANTESLFPFNYTRFVNWAYRNDIVRGVGNNLFHPGSSVTRESAAVMLYRHAHFLAETCTATRTRLSAVLTPTFNPSLVLSARFPNDHHEVSYWARRELAWAVSVGLISGRQGVGSAPPLLAPGGAITRAEGAALISRYRNMYMINTFRPGLTADQGGGNQGGTVANRWNTLNFALGGTANHPTSPATIEAANVLVDDNLSYFLSWFHGGDFASGPVRGGHEFRGWYLDASFTQPVTATTVMPEAEITLHARWEPISVSVLVNSWEELRAAVNNASANIPTTILISNHITAPAAASAINIPANRNITLESNQRFTIRNLDMLTQGQRHFTVSGQLTLGDRIVLRGGTAITNTNNAGGVQVNAGGTLTMLNNSTIQWVNRTGTALADFGGAVNLLGSGTAVGTRATLIIDGGTIQGNSAVSGGGVAARTNAYIDMRSGNIGNNRATGIAVANGGGGVFLNAGTFTLSGGTIGTFGISTTGNRAHRGGGLRISGGTFRMNGGRISGNHATDTAIAGGGGGIFQSGGTINISAGNIENNTAPNGGGVRVTTTAANAFTMTGGNFSSNRATSLTGDGGAIFAGTTTLTANPLPAGVISLPMLNIGADVRFAWNHAGRGASFAPTNATTATRILTTSSSVRGVNHPLNNQDINYWGSFISPVPVWVEVLRSCCPVFSTGFTPAVGAVVQVQNQTHVVSSAVTGSNGRVLVQNAPHLSIHAFYDAQCPDSWRPFVEVADSVAADGTIRIYFAPCHRRSLDTEEEYYYEEIPQLENNF